MHKIKKLKNGLTVIEAPVSGTHAVTFLCLVPIGSRYENKKISGVSHFVEHLMFKGTTKRPTSLDISRELDAAGAQFNAFTDKDRTGYWIKIDAKHQEKAVDILSDMIFNSKFDADDIKREKGVIIEEIRMYDDNPRAAVELMFDRVMYGNHPLGWDIAGSVKGIKAMSRADLFNYYKDAYAPGNMVVVAAGKVDANTNRLIKKYFGRAPKRPSKITKEKFIKFNHQKYASKTKRIDAEKRKLDQSQVIIGYPGLKMGDPRRYALSVMLNILGGGMSSRLFTEVREKRGLAYSVRAEAAVYRDTGAVCVTAGLDPKRLREAVLVISKECERMASESVTEKELIDAKNNIAGHLALAMEDSSAQANWYAGKFWFEKNLIDWNEEIKNLQKVKISDVKKIAAEIFKPSERRASVISPLKKSSVISILK
ncbi:MAG: pitrilysin family protein [Patescibacteria group bacterium]